MEGNSPVACYFSIRKRLLLFSYRPSKSTLFSWIFSNRVFACSSRAWGAKPRASDEFFCATKFFNVIWWCGNDADHMLMRKLDKVVIIDIEATCWNGDPPQDMKNDIIEVGVCLLDIQNHEVTEQRGIIVTPERSLVSQFCTELTTITPELVEKEGIPFGQACKLLSKDYQTKDRPWASFGAYDEKQFRKQCLETGIPYPFGPLHINVKTMFALKKKLSKEVGMAEALGILNLQLDGTHHRGIDDAGNIAKILSWILNN
jgi:inhibitor of KinA sporulation pathway (predicted exonuclease)